MRTIKLLLVTITLSICLTRIYAHTVNQQSSSEKVYDKKQPADQMTPNNDRKNFLITLYTKEGCVYCKKAKQLLEEKGINYKEIDLTTDQNMAKQLCHTTKQCTVPYVYVDGYLIGGYQDLKEMHDNGKI